MKVKIILEGQTVHKAHTGVVITKPLSRGRGGAVSKGKELVGRGRCKC